MKFLLTVNDSSREGFKLSFVADSKESQQLCKVLAEKLIEKIKSIEVKVINQEY